MRKAPSAKQKANWERFARAARARSAAGKSRTRRRRTTAKAAPRRRRRTKPKPAHVRLLRWGKRQVKKHPVRSLLMTATAAGAAHAPTRQAATRRLSGGLARVRSVLPR